MRFFYRVTLADFRSAFYFGATLRKRKPILIALAVIVVNIAYLLLSVLSIVPQFSFPLYILLGYVVCIFLILAKNEHTFLKYIKKEKNIFKQEMALTLSKEGLLTLEVQGEKERISLPIKQLFMVFETSRLFNIYINEEQTILLPKSALTKQDIIDIRKLFSQKLKERFQAHSSTDAKSRFFK